MDFVIETFKRFNNVCIVETKKDKGDKYGRYLADIFFGELHLNKELIDKGLAVTFMEK